MRENYSCLKDWDAKLEFVPGSGPGRLLANI
jgi:hypothetical protein